MRSVRASDRTTTTFVAVVSRSLWCGRGVVATILSRRVITATEATTVPKRDVVGASDALVAPRHSGGEALDVVEL